MLLNWVILLPLSLAAICPMERHQVCNIIAADDAEHVRENRHRCTCAVTPLSDRPPPEQSCTNFITPDEEKRTFPVVSITFNLKESPELEAFPEESFRDTIAGALRVNQDNIVLLRVNCMGTKDTLTVQFGVLKPQTVAELKKKPKKRTVKEGKGDDDDNDDDDEEEEEEEGKEENEDEDETSDAKGDDKNTKNGRKHDDDDDDDKKVKGNAQEDDDDKEEDGEGKDDGDDDENDDDKATVSKIKKHGRKHTRIEAKKSKDEMSKKDHEDIGSVKRDDKKNSGEDGDDDGDEGDEDEDDDVKHKSMGEKDDDKDNDRKHKSRGKKDDDEDDDEEGKKVHKKKKPVKGKSKHRHDDDDDKEEDDDNEDDDKDDKDDDDEEGVEKDDEDDEDEEEEEEKTKEETEEEDDDDDDDDNDDDDDEEEEEEEGEIDYEKVKYVADQFLDAQSIATRMKAMGHLNQIADLQVDSIEFTEDLIDVEYNPDNSALIVQTASAGGLFLFFLIIGTWCMWRRNMFDYSDDLQKV